MLHTLIDRIARHDGLNFAVTNGIPRRTASRFMGWFSGIEHPLVAGLSIRALALFAGDLRLHEARRAEFRSLRDCFTRQLSPGARVIDRRPGAVVSPCDGIVVSSGLIRDTTLIQAKGHHYELEELVLDPELVDRHRFGTYVTLRLTAAMYHRFHAPCSGTVNGVYFVPGDAWNVNPPTLARVNRVYCRNTRAIVPLRIPGSRAVLTLVPVGAVLVSSIQFSILDHSPLRPGLNACQVRVNKGDELGYFQHGSTIVALASAGFELVEHVREGSLVRLGQALWRGEQLDG